MKPREMLMIEVHTEDRFLIIGPFDYDGFVTDAAVKHEIFNALRGTDFADYDAEDIERIVVVSGVFKERGMYEATINNVWPRSFGTFNDDVFVEEEGE